MVVCGYKSKDDGWECFLDALPGEKHCYWHKEVNGKKPTKEQLRELKEKNIRDVYLLEANLQKAKLWKANLQEAKLFKSNLQKANLRLADRFHIIESRCRKIGALAILYFNELILFTHTAFFIFLS
jgi:hypothetical protein